MFSLIRPPEPQSPSWKTPQRKLIDFSPPPCAVAAWASDEREKRKKKKGKEPETHLRRERERRGERENGKSEMDVTKGGKGGGEEVTIGGL